MSDLSSKTERYEELLATALAEASTAVPAETPLADAAAEYEAMAEAYLEDGRHFREAGNDVDALAAYSYGHAWLDAGARIGLFDVPEDGHLFTV